MGTLTGPGLGKFVCSDLATCSLSDLGTADAGDITSGTFGLARIPTMDDAHIPDLETLSYGGTFAEAQIPNLPASKITTGTFGDARIPILPINRYGSAVLVDGSRAMEGTLNIGDHVIDNSRRYMFGGGHEVSLRSVGTYDLYVESKDALHWSNVWMGNLAANKAAFYGTVNVQGHPLTGVVAPTSGSHAANKTWVDSHNWGAGDITEGTFTESRIPYLPTTKITSGTFDSDRIPILPISRYGSAVLVDGSRSMEGTFSMGTHEIDHLKKVMFREEHDVALITEGTYLVSLTNKAESVWGNQSLGWLYVYGGVNMYGYPLTGVTTPTQGSHAANKNYVDNHIWEANDITTGTFSEDRIPNLPTTKITEGTFGAARIPVLPTDRYGSAVLLTGDQTIGGTKTFGDIPLLPAVDPTSDNEAARKAYVDAQGGAGIGTHANEYHDPDMLCTNGSNAMAGTLNMGNHLVDDVKKIGFRDIHNTALITEGTYSISVVNKAESVWGNIETGYSYVHAGFAWYIEDKQAGVNLSGGNLVFLHSDSKWLKTDADTGSATRGLLGIAMAAISANNTGKVCILGRVYNAGWSWTTGATLYVSCTTGGITETAPSGSGDSVRKIGHALSSTTIIFNPDATILEIT